MHVEYGYIQSNVLVIDLAAVFIQKLLLALIRICLAIVGSNTPSFI